MVHRAGLYAISALMIAGSALGQISFPGQYPPGQYPGGRYPGGSSTPLPGTGRSRRSTTTQPDNNNAALITVAGTLRRVSSTDLVIQTDDKRVVTVALASTTKYYKATGGSGRVADLQPGDQVSIDASQDDNGYYHAKNVNQTRQGTPEERAAASEPVDTSPIGDGGNTGADDDRPRLRRAASQDGNTGNANSDDDRPIMRRAPAADDKAQPTGQTTAPVAPQITRGDPPQAPVPGPPDPGDPGPPRLQRGVPAPRNTPPLVAENTPPPARPSIQAQESGGVTRRQAPPQIDDRPAQSGGVSEDRAPNAVAKTGDPVIDNAREAAFSFTETLPNYMVKQFTTRYQTEAAHGGQTSWRALDNVSADVVSDGGKETYKNVLVNGKAPKEAIEKTGSWSTGEFSSQLLEILAPETSAEFHNRRATTIVNRSAYRYDFAVQQANSHWHVYAAAESFRPEYTGSIWIDKETSRVLRIEMSGRNMPRGFPLDTVESATDYDFVPIGDTRFLLPVHSETLSCERGTSICSRNVIDFRNYKKFSADTSITFDDK